MTRQELQATLMRLPPTPWHAEGNVIKSGDYNIAFVKLSRPGFPASFIARMFAKLPELLLREDEHLAEVAVLQRKIEELEERLSDLESEKSVSQESQEA